MPPAPREQETLEGSMAQRVHVGIWYILRAKRGSHIPTLRPKYIPYTYMDPLGMAWVLPKEELTLACCMRFRDVHTFLASFTTPSARGVALVKGVRRRPHSVATWAQGDVQNPGSKAVENTYLEPQPLNL